MLQPLIFALVLAATPAPAPPPPAPPIGDAYPSQEAMRRYLDGRVLEEQGDRDAAIDQYYRAMIMDPRGAGIARRVSELALQRGEFESSLEFSSKAIAADPDDARAHWLRGTAYLSMGRDRDALPPLQKAAVLDSDQVEYQRTLALVAERLEMWPLVARCYRRAVWIDDSDGENWFQLAASEARLGRFGAADTAITTAIDRNPLRPGIQFLRGWVSENLGRDSIAVECYLQHLSMHTDDTNVRRRLVTVLGREKRWKTALPHARSLAHQRPEDLDIQHLYFDIAFEAGQPAEAMHGLSELRRTSGDDPAVLAMSVDLLARHGRAAQAASEAEAWLARHPGDLRARLLAAQAREREGRLDLAERHLQDAMREDPDSVDTWLAAGRFYQTHKRDRDAERAWMEGLKRYPEMTPFSFSLASTRDRLGDLPGAESAVRDVLRREPDNATALNFLGYLFADHDIRLDEAVDLIQRALRTDPDNGAYLDSLGWAYYRLARYDDARELLERAVVLTRGDPVVHEHLGDVYNAMQLNRLARDQYRLALAGDGANSRLKGKLDALR